MEGESIVINEEPVRKRQRRNAIRPYSEETRAIQAVADEYHLRTALDIIQSLNVDSELPEHQVNPPQSHGGVLPDVIHLEGIQPVQTTAFYADSHVIAESTTAVVVGSEEEVPNALAFHLSHVFPIASPISAAPEQTESEQENEEL